MNKQIARQKVSQFYSVWRDMSMVYEEWAKNYGISYNSLLVLYSLWENKEGCTQTSICDEWVLPKQTVNSILKEFENKGYVDFSTSTEDKRVRIVKLTTSGSSFAEVPVAALWELETSIMGDMGIQSAEAMIDNMALFVEQFKKGMVEKDE